MSGNTAEWAAVGVAIVSAGIAAWQAYEARKARTDAENAEATAKKHADAAASTATQTQRIAEAIEQMAAASGDDWSIEWIDHLTFRLRNGTDLAFDDFAVIVERPGGDELELSGPGASPLSVPPHGAVIVEFLPPTIAEPADPAMVVIRPRDLEIDFDAELPTRPPVPRGPGNVWGATR